MTWRKQLEDSKVFNSSTFIKVAEQLFITYYTPAPNCGWVVFFLRSLQSGQSLSAQLQEQQEGFSLQCLIVEAAYWLGPPLCLAASQSGESIPRRPGGFASPVTQKSRALLQPQLNQIHSERRLYLLGPSDIPVSAHGMRCGVTTLENSHHFPSWVNQFTPSPI